MTFSQLRAFLHDHLVNDIMPFWMRFAIDWDEGGLFSCIEDDGVIVSRDKYMWSNARALWTFSALCNRVEDREDWRRAAKNQFDFVSRCGRNEQGYWVFLVDEKGRMVEDANSIVTDAFGIFGMLEYYRLTGDDAALTIARETADACLARLEEPGTYKTAPYPTPPGMKAQREAMQFSLAFCELGHALDEAEWLELGLSYARDVVDHFYRADRDVLLEYMNFDNTIADSPAGRAMVPGHGIESLWFQIHNFTRVGEDDYARRAAAAMRCCFEKGWDQEYGGLFLGIDAEGIEPPYWKHADKKLWWPHTEALPGALMAYEQLGEEWCLDWYWRIHKWTFSNFPNPRCGEWSQRLDRTGNPVTDVIALPVKDPFHLPRGLITCMETLDRLSGA
jgi:N-acylglucosamine 2-epimerase